MLEFETYNNSYIGCIKNQKISSRVDKKYFKGEHDANRTNADVERIYILNSSCPKIPDQLGEVFKNVTKFCIFNSNLSEISKENLKQFPKLEHLYLEANQLKKVPKDLFEFNVKLKEIRLSGNKIQSIESGLLDELKDLEQFWIDENQLEFIPGDFFTLNKKIKKICFSLNEIKFIGPELLDGLEELTHVIFSGNPCISIDYDKSSDGPEKLNEIKQKLKSLRGPLEQKEIVEIVYQESQQKIKQKRSKIAQDQPSCSGHLKTTSKRSRLHSDLDHLLTFDYFKHFTVKIDSAEFKVHKFLLVARSETLAELIKNNPDADELILDDISVEAFEVIFNFLYTNKTPKDSKNAREIFLLALIFKIKKLKEIYGEILTKEVEKVEDLRELLEMYNFGVKYGIETLKFKSFQKINKNFLMEI